MKDGVVIWLCLHCDWWEFGRAKEDPEICPECGGEMFASDQRAVIETIGCMRSHERREYG